MPLTPVAENYLQAIYILSAEGNPVIGARLAQYLGTSPPVVAETIKRLSRDGYVTLGPHKELLLTPQGQEVAEAVARRHRLIERWLVDALGLSWHEIHEEAHRIEHALSPRVEERLAASLGWPATCPHGNPIPGFGQAPPTNSLPLDRASEGDELVVDRITEEAEEDHRLLQYLEEHNLLPGVSFTVKQVAPFAGTISLVTGQQEVTLGLQVAAKIRVRPARL